MRHSNYLHRAFLAALLLAIFLIPGCVGLASQMLYVLHGIRAPAEYDGLEGKRVAVVCLCNTSAYGTGAEASILAKQVEMHLKREVRKIELVPQSEIEDWIDNNGWNELDYREVGRGVKANQVLAIDLNMRGLYEAQTLYKGRAEVTMTVYDLENKGEVAYRSTLPEVVFPTTGMYYTTDVKESTFRNAFLQYLGQTVAKRFYAYETKEDYGRDAALLGG